MVLRDARYDILFQPVSPATSDHFVSFPLAKPYLDVVNHCRVYRPFYTRSREPKDDGEDTLLAETLNTKFTITHWQSFYLPRSSPGRVRPHVHQDPAKPSGELHILCSVSTGLNGKAGLVHGGMLSVLCDELVTLLANLHREPNTSCYTATLKVDYKKPVPSPGSYLMKCWFNEKTGGRKSWVSGEILGMDDAGREEVKAKCEGLVVDVRTDSKI